MILVLFMLNSVDLFFFLELFAFLVYMVGGPKRGRVFCINFS